MAWPGLASPGQSLTSPQDKLAKQALHGHTPGVGEGVAEPRPGPAATGRAPFPRQNFSRGDAPPPPRPGLPLWSVGLLPPHQCYSRLKIRLRAAQGSVGLAPSLDSSPASSSAPPPSCHPRVLLCPPTAFGYPSSRQAGRQAFFFWKATELLSS